MKKDEFIQSLISNLNKLSEEEREDIIQYYNEYFEDAGLENEEKVIEELGDPVKLAKLHEQDVVGAEDKKDASLNENADNYNISENAPSQAMAAESILIEKTTLEKYKEFKNNQNNGNFGNNGNYGQYTSYNQGQTGNAYNHGQTYSSYNQGQTAGFNGSNNQNNQNYQNGQSANGYTDYNNNKKKSHFGLILGIIIAAVVAVVIIIIACSFNFWMNTFKSTAGKILGSSELNIGDLDSYLDEIGVNTNNLTQKNISLNDEFKSLSIDVGASDIVFSYGDSYKVSVDYIDEIEKIDAKVENGKLVISGASMGNSLSEIISSSTSFLKSNGRIAKIEITVPVGTCLEKIEIKDSCGSISLDGSEQYKLASYINVECAAGDVKTNHINSDSAEFTLDCGDITIGKSDIKELTINESLGNVKVEKLASDKLIIVQNCGEVDVNLRDKTPEISAVNDLGTIKLNLADAAKDVAFDLKVDVGTVYINKSNNYVKYSTEGTTKVICNCAMGNIEVTY